MARCACFPHKRSQKLPHDPQRGHGLLGRNLQAHSLRINLSPRANLSTFSLSARCVIITINTTSRRDKRKWNLSAKSKPVELIIHWLAGWPVLKRTLARWVVTISSPHKSHRSINTLLLHVVLQILVRFYHLSLTLMTTVRFLN